MKKYVGLSFLFTLAFFAAVPKLGSQSPAAHPGLDSSKPPASIIVVCDNNYPPYAFLDKNGTLQGIVVDQWQAWEKITGIKVNLQGMDWNLAKQTMASGEADVIDTMFKTAEREKTYEFGEPYAKLDVPVFFHESISGIATVQDLIGFKIAVKEGDACIEVLRSYGIESLVPYPSYEAIVAAAAAGIEKIFCIDQPPALYYLAKTGISTEYRYALNLYTGYFHRAVAKGNAELFRRMESGFAAIPKEEYEKIEQRWLGRSLRSTINSKLLAAIAGSISLMVVLAFSAMLATVLLRKKITLKTRELAETVKELRHSEAKNNAIFEALPDLLFILDKTGRFLEFKVAELQKLYLQPQFFIGKTIQEVFNDDDFTRKNMEAIDKAVRFGGMHIVEYSLPDAGGSRFYESRIVRLDADKVLSIARDVTKEKQADTRIRNSLREKEALLSEIHHRVKNNLQIVSSLLSLQADLFLNDYDRNLFAESQGRIRAMAQVHERLYNSEDFSSISAEDYIHDLVKGIASIWYTHEDDIKIEIETSSISLELDRAVPIGLILNELITNSYKYAFAETKENVLKVNLKHDESGQLILNVQDNGPGMPDGFEPIKAGGLGYTIIRALCEQLHASIRIESPQGTDGGNRGTEISIVIPPHKATDGELS